LIRVLGKEFFGLIAFAQAIIGYLVIFVSFGFNLSATKEISVRRNEPLKLNEIVSSVYIIKFALFLFSFIILALLLFLIKRARGYEPLFLLTMWMCLYELILPVWYFQGIESMKYITYLTLVSRLIFLILIFIFVHSRNDYLLVPLIYGIGVLPSGWASYLILKKNKISFSWQPIKVLKYYFSDSVVIFVSNLSTTLYLNTSKVILGLFLGMKDVATYEIAEKLSQVMKTPVQLIGQAIFPHIAREKNMAFIRKSFLLTIIGALLIMVVGLIFGNFIVNLAGGSGMPDSVVIFRILLITIMPLTFSMFFANLILISWNLNREFLRLRIYSNIFYAILIVMVIFIHRIGTFNIAIITLIVESFAAIYSVMQCTCQRINFL
jgi:PST family polysaccharide transporter